MNSFNKIFLIIISIGLFYSCEQTNTIGEMESKYSVLFNLEVNAEKQKIYIYKTLSNEFIAKYKFDSDSFHPELIVDDAKIKIYSDSLNISDFYVFKEVLNSDMENEKINKYYTNNSEANFHPNTDYEIEINCQNHIIRGNTTTPYDFNIIENKENYEKNKYYIVDIEWTKSKNAKMYFIEIYSYFNCSSLGYDYVCSNLLTEFVDEKVSNMKYKFESHYDSAQVVIKAYDNNYYEYKNNKLPNKGIDNAYGYFCSSIRKEMKIKRSK